GAWNTIGDFPNEFPSTSSSGAAMTELDLSVVGGLQNLAAGTVVVFRLVPYGATSSAGTWYVFNQLGNDLVINGLVSAAAGGAIATPPSPNAAGANLANAPPTAKHLGSVGLATFGIPASTDPLGASLAPSATPFVAPRSPVPPGGAPTAHAA